jgi:hypothetical protein
MEKYLIPHDRMRIDEEERYPFFAMKNEGNGLYSYEYAFQDEQKYSVRIRLGEDIVNSSVYALDDDLFALRPFKGDTHVHTTRSDGKKPPFETACDYRAAGYDFIAITDHHKYEPSIETQKEISSRTDEFTVFRGEEVHNGPMGYVHIVNFGGKSSVSRIIDDKPEYVRERVAEIMSSSALKHLKHPYTAAFRAAKPCTFAMLLHSTTLQCTHRSYHNSMSYILS